LDIVIFQSGWRSEKIATLIPQKGQQVIIK